MDPRVLAALQQQQGGAQPQGGQAQAQAVPGQGGGENPFASLLASFGQGASPQDAMAGGPMAQGLMQGGQGGQAPTEYDPQTGQPIMPPDQTQPGTMTGNSKFLVQAINALQGYIQASGDRDEIATGRSIIALLSRLIEQDQTNEAAKLPQGGQSPMGQ